MLIGNGALVFRQPLRQIGGGAAGDIAAWLRAERVNRMAGGFDQVNGGTPNGTLAPIAWVLPLKPGAMAGRYTAAISVSASAAAVGGVNGEASASMSISAAGAGALVAFGVGSSSFGITAVGDAAGVLQGSGSATLTVSAAGAIGAEANLTGSASFGFSGSLTPYAIGWLSGSTIDGSTLTAAAIAAEVLAAAASAPIAADVQRVRGQDLVGVGTEADPWNPEP